LQDATREVKRAAHATQGIGRIAEQESIPMATRATRKGSTKRESGKGLYTLEVFILDGPISKTFLRKNPEFSRTIQIRGDQTLDDLHRIIFQAFDRFDEHLYEFQFGKGPHDPRGKRYGPPGYGEDLLESKGPAPKATTEITLGELGLKVGGNFGYWFDFGDDWMHQVRVVAIDEQVPPGPYPRIVGRVGKSPPQYPR
jgi:hypothetical protein